MSESGLHSGRKVRLRHMVAALGMGCFLLGLTADLILGGAPGFGLFQIVLLALGGGLLVLGVLGARTVSAYKATAVIGLNTLLLMLAAELGAGVALRLNPAATEDVEYTAYYAAQPWGPEYVREYTTIHGRKMYQPYVIWRMRPYSGNQINVDERGIRRTVGAECVPNAFRVFAFGGSTMWGVGAPDWGTIPSYLLAELAPSLNRPLCVENFGEHGFVSTQSVVQLVRELDAGNVPDLVIFYDGINDVFSTVLMGEAGVHYELPHIRARFEGTRQPFGAWVRKRNAYHLLVRVWPPPPLPATRPRPETADDAARVYLNNHRIVATLAQAYGFEYHFFWQPNLLTGDKPRTDAEKGMVSDVAPAVQEFIATAYRLVHDQAALREHLHDISNALDQETDQTYIDWMHLNPEGNRVVARAIAARVGAVAGTQ